jgi:hypothetical protein
VVLEAINGHNIGHFKAANGRRTGVSRPLMNFGVRAWSK